MYMISFFSALALLNVVLAYYLDGQCALTVLVELCFESLQERTWRQVCSAVLVYSQLQEHLTWTQHLFDFVKTDLLVITIKNQFLNKTSL